MDLFPKSFKVSVRNNVTKDPIGNIAIMVTIFASRKNDHHMIPSTSDEDGNIHFSKEWLNGEIEKDKKFFIMDYSGDLSDCLPKIKILVMSEADIEKAINGIKLYQNYFNYSYPNIEILSLAVNSNYKSTSTIVDLSGEEEVVIKLELEKVS